MGPGGFRGLQNRWGAKTLGGFDSFPFPPEAFFGRLFSSYTFTLRLARAGRRGRVRVNELPSQRPLFKVKAAGVERAEANVPAVEILNAPSLHLLVYWSDEDNAYLARCLDNG